MSSKSPSPSIVLLGAQRFDPTLGDAVRALGVEGPIATITAGWQERESEDQDLHEHLGGRTINLRLHHRADDVFTHDTVLNAAHRERQEVLRHKQDFYRIRLEHELAAHHVIFQRKAPQAILDEEQAASLSAIRQLDEYHLAQCVRVHRDFERTFDLSEREVIARHREEIRAVIDRAGALAIAGGHVATLLNRLRLFGIEEMLGTKPLFAWSAGAMVACERVVLFHDSPPQGPGAAEVLDNGLGLCRSVVPFPQPETRLCEDDTERVSLKARRFAPARCVTLPARAWVWIRDGRVVRSEGAGALRADGTIQPLVPEV